MMANAIIVINSLPRVSIWYYLFMRQIRYLIIICSLLAVIIGSPVLFRMQSSALPQPSPGDRQDNPPPPPYLSSSDRSVTISGLGTLSIPNGWHAQRTAPYEILLTEVSHTPPEGVTASISIATFSKAATESLDDIVSRDLSMLKPHIAGTPTNEHLSTFDREAIIVRATTQDESITRYTVGYYVPLTSERYVIISGTSDSTAKRTADMNQVMTSLLMSYTPL